MMKHVEASVVKRKAVKPLYIVIVRYYRAFLGKRIWEGTWKEYKRFTSRVEAMNTAANIKNLVK